jgi:3-hydroxyisobutyrate dehydrogenase-like beta-hydroxyacid dehydrogenase
MTDKDRTTVTVIGLGTMGSALAGAFLEGGHPTTVWNRSEGKADALVARGAVRAAAVEDAVAASPLTIISLLDYAAVREILDPLGGAVRGKVIANMTTGTPDQARRTARWAAQRGAEYLDGGILADPEQIGTPQARLYFSGSRDAFETHEATLKVLGEDATYYGEDAGLASIYFMALVGLSYEIWVSYLHTLSFVAAENVGAMTFAPAANSVLTPTLDLLTEFARATDEGDYPPVAGPLNTHAALIDDLIATWRARNVDTRRLEYIKTLMDRRVSEGRGADGFSGLIEVINDRRKDDG